jgi:hypothetical protein
MYCRLTHVCSPLTFPLRPLNLPCNHPHVVMHKDRPRSAYPLFEPCLVFVSTNIWFFPCFSVNISYLSCSCFCVLTILSLMVFVRVLILLIVYPQWLAKEVPNMPRKHKLTLKHNIQTDTKTQPWDYCPRFSQEMTRYTIQPRVLWLIGFLRRTLRVPTTQLLVLAGYANCRPQNRFEQHELEYHTPREYFWSIQSLPATKTNKIGGEGRETFINRVGASTFVKSCWVLWVWSPSIWFPRLRTQS